MRETSTDFVLIPHLLFVPAGPRIRVQVVQYICAGYAVHGAAGIHWDPLAKFIAEALLQRVTMVTQSTVTAITVCSIHAKALTSISDCGRDTFAHHTPPSLSYHCFPDAGVSNAFQKCCEHVSCTLLVLEAILVSRCHSVKQALRDRRPRTSNTPLLKLNRFQYWPTGSVVSEHAKNW